MGTYLPIGSLWMELAQDLNMKIAWLEEGDIKMETKVGEPCLQVKELHIRQAPPEANSPSV